VSFNWLDYVLIGGVATVAAVQFLRSTRDFSRVLYETLFTIGAVVAASLLLRPLGSLTGLSTPLLYGAVGVVFVVLGILLAALLLSIACGYALGHLALRTANLVISPHNPAFASAVRHSLMTRDLLYFRTLTEVLVFLRFVRWKGM
jgi:hypothetical protein